MELGSIAKKFKIPVIVIGLTIVAIGTSMPEMVVSTAAAISGHSDMSIGNVVGSNIANLLFILGVCAIIKPLKFKKQTKLIENFIAIATTIILCLVCMIPNYISQNIPDGIQTDQSLSAIPILQITRAEGIILLISFALFIGYTIWISKKAKDEENVEIKELSLLKSCLFVLLGIIALKFGGDLVVEHVSAIAKAIGITERVISLTIVAFSTSLPELITSINATKKGEVDMAIGNIIGSGIFNILLILGVSAVISPINYATSYNFDIILLLVATIIFAIFPFVGKKDYMSKGEGIFFILTYIGYLTYLVAV
jgi:cation:H+ antiporter